MIKFRGIAWSVHPLFVLVMLASVLTGYFAELMTLFTLVLVHEIGHLLAARSFGWTVREVKLLPFGGVVEADESGSAPAAEEAAVAIAGPLQNIWMGALAWLFGYWGWWEEDWSAYIVQANALLVAFNLLPIYPLDGGRLLQSAISLGIPYHRTMVWTFRIGLMLSLAMVVYAVLPPFHPEGTAGVQLNLLMIGLFLLLSNWTYRRNMPYLFIRFLMRRDRVAVRRIAGGSLARPIVVTEGQPVSSVVRLLLREQYHLIYVMGERERIMNVMPERRLVAGYLNDSRPHRAISELFTDAR
ncbi:site-2 protease family protein [Paenibacillus cisolokensis]|uniref:Stage IV sporulation protein FB n=1 Tax=Paenibacillus cisolokensis TaxID=1658519 RepID=A0ABQ4N8R6_9BACL|nr:site-2 protease family protein [Paenibacillus cisolokensis]GIQ64596.1 stage IV sporulation protein FB [Paenibacillus cisolokensis]